VAYLFDEEATALPDLGGIQSSLGKRTRHRRALMRMLFDYYDTDRLLILLDPNNMDLLRDFYSDRSRTKLLDLECVFTDDYLKGHALRVGLLGERTSEETIDRLLPTIRNDVFYESDQIRDANFENYFRMSERYSAEENAVPLAGFLDISLDKARQIAGAEHLFTD
jgi:hypothetical protein